MQKWKSLVETFKYQIYVSCSHDPFLNLSIEQYLLKKTPPHSTILLLYTNRPCVVIGRNQNPWLEVDLQLLRQPRASSDFKGTSIVQPVQLVRRRSGGGTVFHDEGNVNYSVICPTADFTRDKHAEIVTKAIREANLRARVNERHDIVLDQGNVLDEKDWPNPMDMHHTVFHSQSEASPPLKISGSAYKMTRQRSLHHGTCLLASGDLPRISRYLKSPANPFIKARGVESVRSPIGNVHGKQDVSTQKHNQQFRSEVIRAFARDYKIKDVNFFTYWTRPGFLCGEEWAVGVLDDETDNAPEVHNGVEDLKSEKWLYGQTPQFILSSHAIEEDDRARPLLPQEFPASARVYLKVKSGIITSSKISVSSDEEAARVEAENFDQVLRDKSIQDITDFKDILETANHDGSAEVSSISRWLNTMFGKPA